MTPPAPGMHVTPSVQLVRLLASGTTGSVWVARHLTLKREVAVRLLDVGVGKVPRLAERFVREGAAAKVRSVHVVRVFDRGITSDGIPYLIMELLQGETLAQRLARAGRLSHDAAQLLVSQAAQALSQAH